MIEHVVHVHPSPARLAREKQFAWATAELAAGAAPLDPDAAAMASCRVVDNASVALEDGEWHHESSYTSERAHRPSTGTLWRKIRTVEDPQWNVRYHEPDPSKRAFGGRLELRKNDGSVVTGEKAVADAHPNGRSPWEWDDYVGKFDRLTGVTIEPGERDRFIELARALPTLDGEGIRGINPSLPAGCVVPPDAARRGIFDFPAGSDR